MSPISSGFLVAATTFVSVLAAAYARRRRPPRPIGPHRGEPERVPPHRWALARRRGRNDGGQRVISQLDDISGALRAGTSLREAIVGIGGTVPPAASTVLDGFATELARGASLGAVCRQRARTTTDHRDRLVAAAIALAAAGGGQQARAVDATSDAVREHLALAAEVRAQAAQATLSALVLAVTPLVFTAWSASSDARVRSFLFGDPLGVACLAGGLTLDALGGWWMARLCRSVAR
jgi:tight adherence protein B